jgi:hypothetical protein
LNPVLVGIAFEDDRGGDIGKCPNYGPKEGIGYLSLRIGCHRSRSLLPFAGLSLFLQLIYNLSERYARATHSRYPQALAGLDRYCRLTL